MRTLKLTIAYEGTRLVGWQRQADGESIQGLIEAALTRLEGAPVIVHGAGRTDAGVHAVAQVASADVTFTHDTATVTRAVNARLPPDVRVTAVEDAASGFHARFSARGKTYRYLITRSTVASPFMCRFAWHVPEPLDVPSMSAAAAALAGTHDFGAFQSTGTPVATSVRTLTLSVVREGTAELPEAHSHQLLIYEVTGDGFLRHMVRAIVGTLVEIGRGRRRVESIGELLNGASRASAGATAPAQGLFLVRVDY